MISCGLISDAIYVRDTASYKTVQCNLKQYNTQRTQQIKLILTDGCEEGRETYAFRRDPKVSKTNIDLAYAHIKNASSV